MSSESLGSASVPEEVVKALYKPLPPEAVTQHPTKSFLSTIKVIYVVERLNEVFGLGQWFVTNEIVEKATQRSINKKGEVYEKPEPMVIVKSVLTVPKYGIRVEAFGGNDNPDLGDAYKGACTDALSKMGSYLGVGIDVYKGKGAVVADESEKPPKCDICEKDCRDTKVNGALRTWEQAVAVSKRDFKATLCWQCLVKELKAQQKQDEEQKTA
jgi:hypothetical protein